MPVYLNKDAMQFRGEDGQFHGINMVTEENVAVEVSNWLNENISGGETIAVDKSLTVEGAAADAKAVGDLKSALKNEISSNAKVDCTPDSLDVVHGGIVETTGGNSGDTTGTRARTNYIPVSSGCTYLLNFDSADFVIRNAWLYSDSTPSSATRRVYETVDKAILVTPSIGEARLRISFAKNDSTQTISDADLATIKNEIKITTITDETLSVSGVPADSKAVGDTIEKLGSSVFENNTVYGDDYLMFQWMRGFYAYTDGNFQSSNFYITTEKISGKYLGNELTGTPPSGYAIRVYYWDKNGDYQGYDGEHDSRSYPNSGFNITINPEYYYAFEIGRPAARTEQTTLLSNVHDAVFTIKRIRTEGNKTKEIRILGIGNSYTRDSMRWLWKALKLLGYDNVIVGHGYIGGITLEEQYKSLDLSDENHSAYQYWKYVLSKDATKTDGKTLDEIFTDEQWDYVIFQQQSDEAGQYNSFVNNNFDINDFVSYVKTKIDNSSLKIGLSMTWSHSTGYTGEKFIEYYGGDPDVQLAAIRTVIPQVANHMTQCDLIVNPGRAVELGRGNTYLNAIGYEMLRSDKNHLDYGIPSFMAGLVYAQAITGLSVDEIYWYPTATDEGVQSETASEYLLFLAKQCAKNACAFIS